MDKLFNESMTSTEARTALFKSVEGKTKKEIEEIKKEFLKVSHIITRRELDLASKGWFID